MLPLWLCVGRFNLLLAEQVVGLQLGLLSGLLQASAPQPPLPLLGVDGQQQDQAGRQQVLRPAVHFWPAGWQVSHASAHSCSDGVCCCAVPVPERRQHGGWEELRWINTGLHHCVPGRLAHARHHLIALLCNNQASSYHLKKHLCDNKGTLNVCSPVTLTASLTMSFKSDCWFNATALFLVPASPYNCITLLINIHIFLPVYNDRSLWWLPGYLPSGDVVPQGIEGSADEGGLTVKAWSQWSQAVGRGPEQRSIHGLLQRLRQCCFTWGKKRQT